MLIKEKAPGPDGLSNVVIEEAQSVLAPIFRIINKKTMD